MRSAARFICGWACVAAVPSRADPSAAVLSYAMFESPRPTDIITKLSADMVVPDARGPDAHGDWTPEWWLGLQTAKENGALVHPIMAMWSDWKGWVMYHEVFDLHMVNDLGNFTAVQPGDRISASVTYKPGDNSYDMDLSSSSGNKTTMNYKLEKHQKATESVAYFALERVGKCGELPPSGVCSWRNIRIWVNNEEVNDAKWVAKQGKRQKCDSKVVVHNSTAIDVTWTANL